MSVRGVVQRRDFITLLGGAAAAWPVAAGAQQAGMPVIGYLHLNSPESSANDIAAFRKGLSETGFVEGRNVGIEYRFANNQFDRLPALAAELVDRRVAVIVASNTSPALAAKVATTSIPIVFNAGVDAVQVGLVASLNRPGGNITGISNMVVELEAKRLGLLHELLPRATRITLMVDSRIPNLASQITDAQAAAVAVGKKLEIVRASSSLEIDTAFAALVQNRAEAVMVSAGNIFINRRVQIITLAARHVLPSMYTQREFAEAGGLMSYNPSTADLHRQVGIYTGRILKGEKPADLPVMQPTRFEFVINLQTAKTLGITVPPGLLAIADAVIE